MEPAFDTPTSGNVGLPTLPARSAASWSAIIAGAFVAAAVSLVLLALGSGLGFAAISPWTGEGVTLKTFAVTTAIWLIVIQWVASAVGGYIAGRLRTRWIGTNPHEVFFRDTAHGFVTWAVSNVLVAIVIVYSFTGALSGAVHAGGTVGAAAAGEAQYSGPSYVYGLDRLLRSAQPNATATQSGSDVRAEVTHVIAQAVTSNGVVSAEDKTYLADLVAARTGITTEEAQRRVNDFIATASQVSDKAKADADAARNAAAKASIFLALALAIGAFIASLTAALGGKLRDEHP
jgi:hypothetical protein